jgi:hypothetical protein
LINIDKYVCFISWKPNFKSFRNTATCWRHAKTIAKYDKGGPFPLPPPQKKNLSLKASIFDTKYYFLMRNSTKKNLKLKYYNVSLCMKLNTSQK